MYIETLQPAFVRCMTFKACPIQFIEEKQTKLNKIKGQISKWIIHHRKLVFIYIRTHTHLHTQRCRHVPPYMYDWMYILVRHAQLTLLYTIIWINNENGQNFVFFFLRSEEVRWGWEDDWRLRSCVRDLFPCVICEFKIRQSFRTGHIGPI